MEQFFQMTSGRSEDELMKELFDDLFIPAADSQAPYSGPTIQQIETALSYTNYEVHQDPYTSEAQRLFIFYNLDADLCFFYF